MLNLKVFTFNPLQENTYVLFNEEKEAIIIDPGCYYDEERDALLNFITTNKLNPALLPPGSYIREQMGFRNF